MSDTALIETARDFNRFYTNFLGLLNKAYLDSHSVSYTHLTLPTNREV